MKAADRQRAQTGRNPRRWAPSPNTEVADLSRKGRVGGLPLGGTRAGIQSRKRGIDDGYRDTTIRLPYCL